MAPGGPDIAIPVDLDWDEIEAKYWASMKGPRDQAGRQLEQEFDAARKPLEEHVHSQTMMVLSLEEEEREILERLNEVRRLKKDATDDIKRTTTELKAIHLEHRERRRNFEDGMVTWETEKKEYFRQCREKQNETKTVRPAAPVEDGSAAADLNRGGPVQPPDVETLSDNGPREVVMTEDQVPTVPKSNGQEAQVTQDAQDEDVDMSEPNAGEEKQSESTPGVADQSRTAVTEEIATAQQATSQQASAPTVANASDEASTSAATSASLPQVAQPPPVTNGHKEATSGDEQPAEQSSAENAVADAAPAKQPEPPAQPDANKEATIETNVQAQKKDIRQSSDHNATAATKAPQQSPQLTAAESDAAPATLGDKDTEQPAPSASAAGDDDVAMKDVTVAIREKDAEESVDEAQAAEASREPSAATDADVSMADGPADPVSSESVPAEEPAGNSAVPPPTADTLSVVTGKKAVDDDAIESNQATSPASSLSSLTSNFDDLDEPDSSTLRQDTVEVIDQNGLVVGELRPLGRENRSISLITKMPIRRRVQIRTGRNFTTADLEKVHQPNDQKGAKWVSMYIQAVGDIQQHPCQACAKKNGVYQECIMVDNETFSKCGNCEWNRHACLGAGQPGSNSNSRPSSRQSIARQSLSGKVGNRPTTPGGSFTPINQSFASKDGDSISVDGDATTPTGIKNSVIAKKPGRTSLPGARKMASAPGSPTTPMVGTPAVNMAEHDDEEELPPITPDILCLRDDGTVFTDPPLMRGVPLEKIGPDHPYWDPNWEADIASIITQEHQKWMEKYKDMESQGVNDHRKYEAKRQVNRGNTILKWLASGELHPYQLVAKKWMNTKKLIKYNTLYRLAQMLDNELPLYKLNMKASDWMRHRLNELFLEDGDEFNLAAHVAGFYHDPKVQQARDKAGYTSVGRPTKASTKKVAGESAVTPKASVQRPLKRKEPPAAGENTPTAALQQQQQQQQQVRTSPRKIVVVGAGASSSSSSAAASGGVTNQAPTAAGGSTSSDKAHFPPQPLAPDDSDSDDDDKEIKVQQSPAPPRSAIKKKIRLTVNSGSPMAVSATSHDLISDGYTSIDSCSEDKLHDIDWRINQIKTPEVSTHPSVTQYWHFVGPQAGMLEHQVLKQLRPAKWAVFRQPYDFHLRYREVTEIVYATQSLRVIIRFKRGKNQAEGEGRGDMLAEFKRDRTKRRFLKFMASKGVKLLRSSRDYVENAWNDMIPEFNMPGNDSD